MLLKSMPTGLRKMLIGSGLVHLGLLVGLVLGVTGSSWSKANTQTVITTKLIRLGKERPEDFLPRKPKEAPPASKALPIGETPAKAEPEKGPKTATDRANDMRKFSDALKRLKSEDDEEPEGRSDGSKFGNSSIGQDMLGDRYATEIYECVKDHYDIEGIAAEKVKDRRALVFVRVNAEGAFFDMRIEKSSGIKAFDRSVEKAVRRCGRVSKPPKEIAKQMRDSGVEFEFTL